MCRWTELVLCLAIVGFAPIVRAQEDEPATYSSGDTVERYLESLGLDRLRAVHLERQVETLDGEARALAATRLASLYGKLLEVDKDPVFRRELEVRSRALLRLVPPDEVDDLRLTIVKARYFQAERESQASLLGATTPEEDQELAREFLELLPDLRDIAKQAQRDIRSIETRMRSSNANIDEATERAQLDTLRSRVSQARYYLGWSQVELARLTGQSRHAEQAMEDFGWLLGSGGDREPSIDAVAPGLLSYSHVARAALGCARAAALRGDDVNAKRWLDLVIDAGETLSEDVHSQLLAHEIVVLSQAKRWADLQVAVDEAHLGIDGEPEMLSPLEARLLAVSTLSAMASDLRGPVGEARRALLEAMAQVALSDLIEQDQLGEVLAIVTRFGTLPIGQRGFIVHYVRAMRAVERAESTQTSEGEPLGSVTASEAVTNRYLEAAAVFELAVEADDADRFTTERADAAVLWGRCLFVAGQFEQAADVFARVASMEAVDREIAEEAAWNEIVALDRGIQTGRESLAPRRDEASEAFLVTFPSSDRAAELLVRRASGGLLPRIEAIEILLAVDEESELFRSARLMAIAMLFEEYRGAKGPTRAQAADRFVRTADTMRESLAESASPQAASPSQADEVADIRERLGRQMLDAAFATSPPSVRVIERVLAELEAKPRGSIDPVTRELLYRRLQLAIIKNEPWEIERRFNQLAEAGGDYVRYAESLLYERAARARREDPADLESAQQVMVYGQRLLSGLLKDGPDESFNAVATDVVLAANAVYRAAQGAAGQADTVARDLAVSLAEQLREADAATAEVLVAHARLADEAGDAPSAIESWRLVLSAMAPGSSEWMDARLESILVLAKIDRPRAAQVLEQFDLLYKGALSDERRRQRDRVATQVFLPTVPEPANDGGGA